ncbi:GTP-binding protein, partial [Planctomycetota bacterium]|nr:GTP-binding protein [Planctomycetota bacterium]
MKIEQLRNFGILAHIDAGKTTLSECILYLTGAESRMGAVDVGTAVMDWHSEERERGITISAAVAHCPWRDHRLQFVDTPGHVDFAAEVRRSLQVLDGALVVVDALEGVQAQTYSVVRQAQEHQLPLLFVF